MKPVPQSIVLLLVVVFTILGYFAGVSKTKEQAPSYDLNRDGEINLQDFSIALYLIEGIQSQMHNQDEPANVIQNEYPPVPLPYQPILKTE